MKGLRSIVIALVSIVAIPAFAVNLTQHGYVQDGLVAQWDGIDNVGSSSHDSSTTIWKDLVGGVDMDLTANGSWNANGNALVVNGLSAAASKVAPDYKTIELVYRKTSNYGRIMFSGGDVNQFVIFDEVNSLSNRLYFAGVKPTKSIEFPYRPSEIIIMAAEYDDDQATSSIFLDGEAVTTVPKNDTWGNGAVASVGGRKRDGYGVYEWYGEVYAIRLYNRRLTKWERANNFRVDCKRFLVSTAYIQDGLLAQWDGLDNAGVGVHDNASTVWKNLAPNRLSLAEDGLDLTVRTGLWQDSALQCVGSATPAASSSTNFTFNTLEVMYENTKLSKTSSILFSGGYLGGPGKDRYLAIGSTYLAWVDNMPLTYEIAGAQTPGKISLAWTNPSAYANAKPLTMENKNADWGLGKSTTINLGCRIEGNTYPFTGNIHSIRAYSGKLSADQVAYNFKIDNMRYVEKTENRSLTWHGPSSDLGDGQFGGNGNWTVTGDGRTSRALPTIGDTAVLPSGEYTVSVDEPWNLAFLTLGAGVKLSIALPVGDFDSASALIALTQGLSAEATAEVVFDAEAFDALHEGESLVLISCGVDSTASLQRLADRLRTKYGRRRAGIVTNGTKLIYNAPPDPGCAIILR